MSVLLGAGLGACPSTMLSEGELELPFEVFNAADLRGGGCLLSPLNRGPSLCFKLGPLTLDKV